MLCTNKLNALYSHLKYLGVYCLTSNIDIKQSRFLIISREMCEKETLASPSGNFLEQ